MEISEKDYKAWRTHPVTREVFKILRERQLAYAVGLAEGMCLSDPEGYAVTVGRYGEIVDLLDMEFKDMEVPKGE